MDIPSARNHISFVGYTLVCFAVSNYLQFHSLEFIAGLIVGCILPDCDHKEAIISKLLPLYFITKHGRATHTILVNLVLYSLWYYYKFDVLLGLSIGYSTHLYIDDIDGKGLKYLFWPIWIKKR